MRFDWNDIKSIEGENKAIGNDVDEWDDFDGESDENSVKRAFENKKPLNNAAKTHLSEDSK